MARISRLELSAKWLVIEVALSTDLEMGHTRPNVTIVRIPLMKNAPASFETTGNISSISVGQRFISSCFLGSQGLAKLKSSFATGIFVKEFQ
jgi:hypothetical protein